MNNKRKEIHNEDSVSAVIRTAVIRDETGNLRIRQCHPKVSTDKARSRAVITFNDKTVGDILNKLRFNSSLRKIVKG